MDRASLPNMRCLPMTSLPRRAAQNGQFWRIAGQPSERVIDGLVRDLVSSPGEHVSDSRRYLGSKCSRMV